MSTLESMGVGRMLMKDPLMKDLRPSKRRQQVAAVCYRVGKGGIEFLLVQTRSGRWIFPKGGVEPGLTLAQSAALEAVEEAGAHGRIEEIPFARYFRRMPDPASVSSSDFAVAAHLCEVTRLERPQESNRRPSWFSAERSKRQLIKDRTPEFGAELARVIDRAVSRIRRLQSAPGRGNEHLQKVRFEFLEGERELYEFRKAVIVRNILEPRTGGVLRLGTGKGSAQTHNVTAIDSARRQSGAGDRRRRAARPS